MENTALTPTESILQYHTWSQHACIQSYLDMQPTMEPSPWPSEKLHEWSRGPRRTRVAQTMGKINGSPLSEARLPAARRRSGRHMAREEARILVGAEQSGGNWWLARVISEPARKTSLPVHLNADEQFYVLEGFLSVWWDGRWQNLPAGALAIVPRRLPHALGNRSRARFLASGSPAGFEKFFPDIEATARPLPYGSPEFLAELAKVYTKYDSELL